MALIKLRQRKDGKAKGVLVRTSGKHSSVKIARAKAARVRRNRRRL